MKFKWRGVAGVAAAVALVALGGSPPARADGSVALDDDSATVEWDPACVLDAIPTPFAETTSPGASGCSGLTAYDGDSEVTDLSTSGTSFTTSGGQLIATFQVDGPVPAAGAPVVVASDDPDQASPTFTGGTFYAMFQNLQTQTNVPTNATYGGGCTSSDGREVRDQHGSWKDGYHQFLYFRFRASGNTWTHRAGVGTYVPNSGFTVYELATNAGSGWTSDEPAMPFGSAFDVSLSADRRTVTVTVNGKVTSSSDFNCRDGVFTYVYAAPGNDLVNIKAVTTSDVEVPLIHTCPMEDLCTNDWTDFVGGFSNFTDQTAGSSNGGLLGCNPVATSLTRGCHGTASAYLAPKLDTLGDGPTCPTPTVGGTLPDNPLFVPDRACQIDDDVIARGSVLAEFWETPYSVVA